MNVFIFHFQGGTNGPETISIKGENIPDGVTAMYYIKDYSNVIGQGSMSFKQSDAKVHFKLSYLQFWELSMRNELNKYLARFTILSIF